MEDNARNDPKTTRRSSKGDRAEIVKVLVLALVSFSAGFALVFLFLRPSSGPDEEPTPDVEGAALEGEPAPIERYAPDPSPADVAQEGPGSGADEGAAPHEGDAPPEVPPGRTPEGVAMDGGAFYLKCWDADGVEHDGEECDRLEVLEKRFSTRLYVVDECRVSKAGEGAHGKLSLAVEVDFADMSLSFWNGASSNLEGAARVATCLRTGLAGLPLHSVDHEFQRYRVFFTILFGKPAEKLKEEEKAPSRFVTGKGRLVDVEWDHVRVREKPVDGEVIGKISSDSQVRLVGQEAGWCHIITPNDNEGWMTCDALAQ